MRISKRICSVILAGTLACGLGFGSFALADSAVPGTEEGAGVAEALASLQSTQLSYETFSAYGVQLLLPEGLSMVADVTEEFGDVMLAYEDEKCGIEVEITALGLEEENRNILIETIVSAFTEEFPNSSTAVSGYLVDGSRLVDVILFVTDEGTESTEGGAFIELTFLFTEDATATVISYVAADDDETLQVLGRVHSSLAPSASNGSAAGAPAATEPGTVPTTEPTEPTAKPAAPSTGVAADAAVFELPGWNVAINTDAMLLDTIPEDFWDTDVAGKSVIAVPVTLTNTGTETSNAWWDLTFQFFGPKGVAQGSGFSWVFDDDFANLPDMRKGATADAYLYIEDEGDGVYAIEVSAFDEDFNNVKYEVEFELTHDA